MIRKTQGMQSIRIIFTGVARAEEEELQLTQKKNCLQLTFAYFPRKIGLGATKFALVLVIAGEAGVGFIQDLYNLYRLYEIYTRFINLYRIYEIYSGFIRFIRDLCDLYRIYKIYTRRIRFNQDL